MRNIAETIPEYKALRAMHGVGDRLGPIILAEIGDVRRFHSGKALNSLCRQRCPSISIRTIPSRNRHISKRGSSALRKACYEVMQALKLTKPQDDPVYLFMLKKRARREAFQRSQDGWREQVPPDLLRQSNGALQVNRFDSTSFFSKPAIWWVRLVRPFFCATSRKSS